MPGFRDLPRGRVSYSPGCDLLEEDVILPVTRDLQASPREAEPLECVALQYPL